jgi:hypothetical protein
MTWTVDYIIKRLIQQDFFQTRSNRSIQLLLDSSQKASDPIDSVLDSVSAPVTLWRIARGIAIPVPVVVRSCTVGVVWRISWFD